MKTGKKLGIGLILATLTKIVVGYGNSTANTSLTETDTTKTPEASSSKKEKFKIIYSMRGSASNSLGELHDKFEYASNNGAITRYRDVKGGWRNPIVL